MPALALSPVGLLLAAAMSVTNVMTDVARKRALEQARLVTGHILDARGGGRGLRRRAAGTDAAGRTGRDPRWRPAVRSARSTWRRCRRS